MPPPPIEPTVVRVSPTCCHCGGTHRLILRDGPPICRPCIWELVHVGEAERMRLEMERIRSHDDDVREGWRP